MMPNFDPTRKNKFINNKLTHYDHTKEKREVLDPEHFVTFKNRNVPPLVSEILRNLSISLRISD